MTNTYKRELEKTERKKKRNRRRKPGRQQKLLKILKIVMIVLLIGLIVAIGSLFVLRTIGKKQLQDNRVGSAADMQSKMSQTLNQAEAGEMTGNAEEPPEPETEAGSEEEKEGRVYYNGKAYEFNEDIMTFLVMGIDQHSETVKEYTEGFEGGSAVLSPG